jgi:Rod binding domain-containing protein
MAQTLPAAFQAGPAPVQLRPSLAASQAASPDALRKSAEAFEAMAIGQFLEPMFDTINTANSPFGGGNAEASWKPMLIQEFGKQIAAHGGIGLAQPVYEAMLRMQEEHMQKGKPS